jgi:hypothetical protein
MHPNPAFRQSPRDQNLAFARARGFGILTINGPEGPLAALPAERGCKLCRTAPRPVEPDRPRRASGPGADRDLRP